MHGVIMASVLDLLDGDFEAIELPEVYQQLWDDINLPIQSQKAAHYNLPTEKREQVLTKLSKRAYFLTRLAEKFEARNIVEIGTAEGWQFYSFAEYCTEVNGKVWSCDIFDKHHKGYSDQYSDVATFVHGDSEKLASLIESSGQKIDLFYVDGSHERGAVLRDVKALKKLQCTDRKPVWIFDDYDDRFGCYHDISTIAKASTQYFVYSPGRTASNNPTHQLVMKGRFQ